MFFKPKDPKTELEGLDRALEILQDRYDKKDISLDDFSRQCQEIAKKREKYQKKLEKQERKMY